MKFKQTALLFGALLVLGIVLLIVSLTEDDKTPSGALLDDLAGAKFEQINNLELERGSARLVINRTDNDQWVIAEPVTSRADSQLVKSVVEAILRARPTAFGDITTDPVLHGLQPPSLRVTLRDSNGKSGTLNIGKVLADGPASVAFVTTPKRPRPMAVLRSDLEPLFKDTRAGAAGDLAKWTNDYRVKQIFAVDPRTGADDVSAIKLAAKGKELALAKAAGNWQFTAPAGWGDASAAGDMAAASPAAINGVRGLLNTVANLQAAGADDFIDHPTDLKQYGLNPDNPDLIRVELKAKDGAAETALIGKVQPPAAPAEAGKPPLPAPPAKFYAKLEGTSTVVHVNPPPSFEGIPAIIANPDPLRDRDLVKAADKNRIDAIDITAGGQTTKLRKSGPTGTWKLFGGPGDPQDANAGEVQKLIDLLAQPHVVKDFPPANDANFAPAEIRSEIKLWADSIKPNADAKADPKAEPKVDGPPTVLQFSKKAAEGILVRRTRADGTKTECRLPEKVKVAVAMPPSPHGAPPPPAVGEEVAVAAAIAKSRLDFLDPSLKRFSAFQAGRITIQKGTNITEAVREKSPLGSPQSEGKWKFVKPDAQKDRTADSGTISDLLVSLSTEFVVRFIAESPSDAELAKWGLDPKNPKLKVTVDLGDVAKPENEKAKEKEKDKENQRVYYFGNETEDKQYVYARQDGKSAVFTVPKLTPDKIATADLRDRTVVHFDKAKVKKISLRGWKEKTGFEVELVFERKDGKWTVAKAPGKYDVDSAKVDRFIDGLHDLRAKAFIAGAANAAQKLAPAEGGLQIVLEIEGVPSIALAVGGPTDGDASLFVQTSTLPANGNIVTVVSDTFKPYKDNSAAFAK